MSHRVLKSAGFLSALLVVAPAPAVQGQIMISANDGKGILVNGVNTVPDSPPADNVTIYDLGSTPPKLLGEIAMPTSLVGPPSSVAIAPDGSFALVSAATKLDPANAKKTIADNRVSVIDLKAKPPAVVATLEAGAGPSGVAINKAGTLALVANRQEGSVSVFSIAGNKLSPAGKVQLGDAKSGPSAVAFTPDGKTALVTRDGDHKISVLSVDGTKVEATKRDLHAGLKPYPLSISPKGDFAVVTNIGMGGGDSDTMSLIDLKASPPRVVDTVSVGQTPESVTMAPDGLHVAVGVMNGSNKPSNSPFVKPNGLLAIYAIKGGKLAKVTEGKVGHWCQGIGWRKDSKLVAIQCMVESEIQLFGFNGKALKPAGALKVKGGPAGLGVSGS